MKNLDRFWLVFAGTLGFSLSADAAVRSFDDLWSQIRAKSPELRARAAGVEAASEVSTRSRLHWMPRLFLDARGVSTNDPGMNFAATLSQRAIGASDFNPGTLNAPGTNSFLMAGLGMELAVYEGGIKVATEKAQSRMLELERVELAGAELAAWSDSALEYGRFLSIEASLARLQELKTQLQGVLERYAVGASSNPVGYSGLLGLKGLKNRMEAAVLELSMERGHVQQSLAIRAGLEDLVWSPSAEPLEGFLDRVLPARPRHDPSGIGNGVSSGKSVREWSADLRSEALAAWKSAERARFFPHVGLFGNESVTSGSRATGTSTTLGVYLKWTLFDPENWGRVSERSSREQAARFSASSESLEKQIADHSMVSSDATFRENRKLLLESEQLLSEQVRVAFRLFQSGSIQALQLAEVLNRRVDLVMNLKNLEGQWVGVRAALKKNSTIEGVSL